MPLGFKTKAVNTNERKKPMKRKFKRLLSVILCVAVTVSAAISGTAVFAAGIDAWDGTRAESYAGGSGTAEDPYLISTPEQLALLVCDSATYKKYYRLTADIYLNNTTRTNWKTAARSWYTYSDNGGVCFGGSLNGGGHTVYGLYYSGDYAYVGLFSRISDFYNKVNISNIRIADSEITTTGNYAAAITGFEYNYTGGYSYTDCIIDSTVSICSAGYASGLAAWSNSETAIAGCASYAVLTGKNNGGLTGYYAKGTKRLNISNSFSVGFPAIASGSADSASAVYENIEAGEIYGAKAKTAMPGLSWDSVWFTAENSYPVNAVFYKFTVKVWNGSAAAGYAGGTGTADNPYLIATAEQLARMIKNDTIDTADASKGKYYKLIADIYLNDTSREGWKGDSPNAWYTFPNNSVRFAGSLDGDGHTVYGVYQTGNIEYGGLIPIVNSYYNSVSIKNLTLADSYIVPNASSGVFAGVLFGRAYGNSNKEINISRCYIKNSVIVGSTSSGTKYIGGLVGFSQVAEGSNKTLIKITDTACLAAGVNGELIEFAMSAVNFTWYAENWLTVSNSFALCKKWQGVTLRGSISNSYLISNSDSINGDKAVSAMPDLDWSIWQTTDKYPEYYAEDNSESVLHPADGKYNAFKRVIEFDKYVVGSHNTFIPTGTELGEYSGVPYFKVIDDPDEEGDKILHYYNHSASSWWYPNWTLTPTEDGTSSAVKSASNCTVLDTGSAYRVKMKIRVNNLDGGKADLFILYGTGNSSAAFENGTNCAGYEVINSEITETDGKWVEIESCFTTPASYATVKNGVANRFILGISLPRVKVDYDLDTLTLEKVTSTELYIKQGGKYVLFDTLRGLPGTELDLPDGYYGESYSNDGPTGCAGKLKFGKWYANAECTEASVLKYGNFDTALYCGDVSSESDADTENQELFVGFDTYTERTAGLGSDTIKLTNEDAYTGEVSLKASLSAGTSAAFELKNDYTFDVIEGKTYKLDFFYKASVASELSAGLSRGSAIGEFIPLNSVKLQKTDAWAQASIVFTADTDTAGCVLSCKISSDADAEILTDTFVVSSVTKSVGVKKEVTKNGAALRFTAVYGEKSKSTVKISGTEYAVAERGILVKSEEVKAELTLDNKNLNGIFCLRCENTADNWSHNSVTGDTVYSAYIDGFDKEDGYNVSARGYIKLSNGDVFYSDTVTACAADIKETGVLVPDSSEPGDCYVYLPEGTVFGKNTGYSVTAYNALFKKDANVIENNTLKYGSYVIFSDYPDRNTVKIPDELEYQVHSGTKEALYLGLNSAVVSRKINSVGKKSVNYIFITDIHYGSDLSDLQKSALINQIKLVTDMANRDSSIDFVVIGGDNTDGAYPDKQTYWADVDKALSPLKNCNKPVFVLMGDHDDNSYHLLSSDSSDAVLNTNAIITNLDWQKNMIDVYSPDAVQDKNADNSKYYYYDLTAKKTRVICLDSLDYEAKYDENGYVITADNDGDALYDGMPARIKNSAGTDRSKYWTGTSWRGYGAKQVKWLAEEALGKLPADYNVIFVSHMGIDSDTSSDSSAVMNGSKIRDIIKAYNAKVSYSAGITDVWGVSVTVRVDFAEKSGKALSYQFGHRHTELTLYSDDIDLFLFGTSAANAGETDIQTDGQQADPGVTNSGLPRRFYKRELGGDTEACFNVMSVSEKQAYRFTVGAGRNEKAVYPDIYALRKQYSPLKLAEEFGDNMVLQRGSEICIYGIGYGDGTVTLGNETKDIASKTGYWKVYFSPLEASLTPVKFTAELSGKKISFSNVLIGDVYVSSGQSNMELTIADTEHKDNGDFENAILRFKNINTSKWAQFSNVSVQNLSAVSTLFAEGLAENLENKIPIGIISTAVGASRIEDWTADDYCTCDPNTDNLHSDAYYYDKGDHDLFKKYIKPISDMSLSGVLWYQGESNRGIGEAYKYYDKFENLVNCWRNYFGKADLPFYTVQIMLFSADNSIDNNGNAVDEYNIRIAQGKAALNIPNVTVCTMLSLEDTLLPNGGLNIHPTDKAPIAEALVKAAIACRYIPAGDYSGAAEEYSGPLADSFKANGNTAVVTFRHTGEGLILTSGASATEFEVRDRSGNWVSATAVPDKNTVTVTAAVDVVTGVRMGYRNRPSINLYNITGGQSGYCASPFILTAD